MYLYFLQLISIVNFLGSKVYLILDYSIAIRENCFIGYCLTINHFISR